MGTSGVVRIKDEWSDKFMVAIYQQCDGYVSGYGKKIQDILKGCSIINGITYTSDGKEQRIPHFFNGMGCMAAYLIEVLKHSRIGYIYLVPEAFLGDFKYTYDLELSKEVPGLIRVKVYRDDKLIADDLLDNVDMENLEKNLKDD
jgi:hypothetical protein